MHLAERNPGVCVACTIGMTLLVSDARAASPARHHADLTLAAFLNQDAIEVGV